MLARIFRLQKKDVEKVYRKGRAIRFNNFLIRTSVNRANHARFAVIIPKKTLAKAVDRNKARREVYNEIFFLKNLWENVSLDVTISFRKYDKLEINGALNQIFKGGQ